jgi:hypothetical protein
VRTSSQARIRNIVTFSPSQSDFADVILIQRASEQ